MTTWKKSITAALSDNKETWADVQSHTLTEEQLNAEFDDGYGGTEGAPFTLWTTNRVYFPICYDGAEWCGSVARNPDGKPTEHQGGG